MNRPPFPSFLTYGPRWPNYRTNGQTGDRYRWSDISDAWLWSVGPE